MAGINPGVASGRVLVGVQLKLGEHIPERGARRESHGERGDARSINRYGRRGDVRSAARGVSERIGDAAESGGSVARAAGGIADRISADGIRIDGAVGSHDQAVAARIGGCGARVHEGRMALIGHGVGSQQGQRRCAVGASDRQRDDGAGEGTKIALGDCRNRVGPGRHVAPTQAERRGQGSADQIGAVVVAHRGQHGCRVAFVGGGGEGDSCGR